jgi:hypothetical protein
MDAFAIPLFVFTGFMIALFVAIMGSIEDSIPRRAGVLWAITCPLSGLFLGIGLPQVALVTGGVSVLALCALAAWFLVPESDDTDDDTEEPVEPDPGPSDDVRVEIPVQPEPAVRGVDWDEFDRDRADWEREPLPERV